MSKFYNQIKKEVNFLIIVYLNYLKQLKKIRPFYKIRLKFKINFIVKIKAKSLSENDVMNYSKILTRNI